jgi:hypothetical protein
MFITHKKGLKPDGKAPTLLYGYGGFNISLTPSFSVGISRGWKWAACMRCRICAAAANTARRGIRRARKLKKQNVFDDFIAAAEWLIANGYTNPKKLAIAGGSNGGLLVGACMTQRPDLFGACLPAVGVMDMLRFHKFTIGWAWTSDYGSADNAEEFRRSTSIRRCTTSSPARSIPRRWSRRPITTTAWCRRTASSSPPRCRPRRLAQRRADPHRCQGRSRRGQADWGLPGPRTGYDHPRRPHLRSTAHPLDGQIETPLKRRVGQTCMGLLGMHQSTASTPSGWPR